MFWFVVIVVLLVFAVGTRRLLRGRRAPQFDQKSLDNATYSRIGQDVHNQDVRFGGR